MRNKISKISSAKSKLEELKERGHINTDLYNIYKEGLDSINVYLDKLNNDFWINSEGEVVEIKDMDNEYLENVIRKLRNMESLKDDLNNSLLYSCLAVEYLNRSVKNDR